jgi:hypothetical protein
MTAPPYVTVCHLELLFCQRRKSLQQEWAELIGPDKVHDLFMSKHGVCKHTACTQERCQ